MGNLLGAPITKKDTHKGSTEDGTINFAVTSMQGWRVHMEDAHIVEPNLYAALESNADGIATEKLALPRHGLYAVFDGHGGSYSALYSGRNLCRVLSCQAPFVKYAKMHTDTTTTTAATSNEMVKLLETALADAFVEIDKEIACALQGNKVAAGDSPYHEPTNEEASEPAKDSAAETDQAMEMEEDGTAEASNNNTSSSDAALQESLADESDSGTTACVVLLTPEFVLCANAGDSRGVLMQNGNGNSKKVIPLSFDHKPDDESEERRIRAAGGFVAGGRVEGDLAVSRGLGDFRFKTMNVVMKGGPVPEKSNATATTTTNNNMVGDEDHPDDEDDMPRTTAAPSISSMGGVGRPVVTHPGDQKVSPIPDVLIHKRNVETDAFALIACDGIWDVQTNEQACNLTADLFNEGETDLGLMCEEICDVCLRLGSKDNMTSLILQFPAQTAKDDNKNNNAATVSSGPVGVLLRRQQRESENSVAVAGSG
mmetsp:Transcript_11181/g.24957  ORF Transcript_11181/g.24957 Transcript_11181/m.24957 type:complete len:484 (+) Transcript_11181:288-1739(+)|eukprot:CAMPEP_0168745704 /NCGR_PEP_ID=MMETSP0724-20121128/14759_1 /TAXON_ID=265536 /ORGANISM="Amphiprora sp., Strain CCMP467" /LENGTH=483 /DNA_ID=CAMNT_0008793433 /DNA_START=277 /DNA_END=1731 /DNA_ORIENTATION=+